MRYLALWLIAAGAIASGAATRYCTFAGRISEIDQGFAAVPDSLGIRVGDTVSYVFAVDRERPTSDPRTFSGIRYEYLFDSLASPSLFSAMVENRRWGTNYAISTSFIVSYVKHHQLSLYTTTGESARNTQVFSGIIHLTDTTDILPKPGAQTQLSEVYYVNNSAAASVKIAAVLTAVEDSPPNVLSLQKPKKNKPRMTRRGDAWEISGPEGVPIRATLFDASGRTLSGIAGQGARQPLRGFPAALGD